MKCRVSSLNPTYMAGRMFHEYEVLLERATDDLRNQHYSLSILMSHAAIEICTEIAFKLLFSIKGIEYLYDAVVHPAWKFNDLSSRNQQTRRLYTSLSGEPFGKKNSLWKDLDEHWKKRHLIAHRGITCSKKEAEFSLAVAMKYIEHITNTIEGIKSTNWGA